MRNTCLPGAAKCSATKACSCSRLAGGCCASSCRHCCSMAVADVLTGMSLNRVRNGLSAVQGMLGLGAGGLRWHPHEVLAVMREQRVRLLHRRQQRRAEPRHAGSLLRRCQACARAGLLHPNLGKATETPKFEENKRFCCTTS